MNASHKLYWHDYALLALLGVLLFGYTAISGKPLTMHEARLPQTSLEMLANGEWLFPHSGETAMVGASPAAALV